MSFVNRELKEEEKREYELVYPRCPYKYRGGKGKFDGGTIDDENDVRVHIYGDAMISGPDYGELSDREIKYGILDFKGDVYFFTVRQKPEIDGNNRWLVDDEEWLAELDDEKKEFLRKALIAYGNEGYRKIPLWGNENAKVIIDF